MEPFDFDDLVPGTPAYEARKQREQAEQVAATPPVPEEGAEPTGMISGFDEGAGAGMAMKPFGEGMLGGENLITPDNLIRPIARGVPVLGAFADEMNAATNATFDWPSGKTWRERYASELTKERERDRQFDEKHPNMSLALQILGGGMSAVAAAPVVGPAIMSRTTPLPLRMAGGAGGGAAVGTAHGFGQGEGGFQPRSEEALSQGAVGASLGAAIPAAAKIAGTAYRGGKYLWDRIAKGLNIGDGPLMPSPAETRLARAYSDDMVDPAAAADMGEAGMVMDLGPNLQQQAAYIATKPGPGQQQVRSAIRDRKASTTPRITEAVSEALGPEWDTAKTVDDILEVAQQKAGPLYNEAYATPIELTENMADLLDRPAGRQAINRAKEMMANDGAVIPPDDQVNVEMLDYVKKALYDMEDNAKSANERNTARILSKMRKQLVADVDDQVPVYKQARAVYEQDAKVVEAMGEGSSIFEGGKVAESPKAFRRRLEDMDESQRAAFMIGARSRIAQIMGTSRNDALAAIREMKEKGWNREKLGLLIGEDRANRLMLALDNQKRFMDTETRVVGNSETSARLRAGEEFGGEVPHRPGVVESLFNINVGSALHRGAQKLIDTTSQDRARRIAEEAASLLTARGGSRDDVLRRIAEVVGIQHKGKLNRLEAERLARTLLTSPSQTTGRAQ